MVLQERPGLQQVMWDDYVSKLDALMVVFSSHRQKRMKQMKQKMKQGKANVNEDDPFELFILSTNIRYCYYAETQKILGNTYGVCILQVCLH